MFVCLFVCEPQPVVLLVRKAGKEGLERGPENGQPVALLVGKAGNEAADESLGIEGLEPGPENGHQREVVVTLDKSSAGTLMRFTSLVHLLKNAMVEPDIDALRKLIAGNICKKIQKPWLSLKSLLFSNSSQAYILKNTKNNG